MFQNVCKLDQVSLVAHLNFWTAFQQLLDYLLGLVDPYFSKKREREQEGERGEAHSTERLMLTVLKTEAKQLVTRRK